METGNPQACDATWCYKNAEHIQNPRYFSKETLVDSLEVQDGVADVHENLRDSDIKKYLEEYRDGKHSAVRFRMIFIPEIRGDTRRLHITSSVFQDIFATFNVSPRFAMLLTRQHTPNRVVQQAAETCHHQFWWTAVMRSTEEADAMSDPCRAILHWSRLCIWARYELETATTTVIVLRCPEDQKETIKSTFGGRNGVLLQQNPMNIHTFLLEGIILRSADFHEVFWRPLYAWELKINAESTAGDVTERSQSFLNLARKITQTLTDYDILEMSIEFLARQHIWLNEQSRTQLGGVEYTDALFEYFLNELRLLRAYLMLYEKRSRIGIDEGFAMVNQRDSDVNLRVASETAQIARDAREDGQSLRIIQILSMLFLPASLISGIFGMVFFKSDNGKTDASSDWWLYPAVSVPLTLFIVFWMGGWRAYQRWLAVRAGQGGKAADLEMNSDKWNSKAARA